MSSYGSTPYASLLTTQPQESAARQTQEGKDMARLRYNGL